MSDTESNEGGGIAGYASLVGRTVMVGNRRAMIVQLNPERDGRPFTIQLAPGVLVGCRRDEFYVLPTQEEIAEAIDPEPEDKGPDNPWTLWIRRKDSRDQQAAAVLALLTRNEDKA